MLTRFVVLLQIRKILCTCNQVLKYCFSVGNRRKTVGHSRLKVENVDNKILGKIFLRSHGTQNFNNFVLALNTAMRKIDFKGALKTSHSLKKCNLDILEHLLPALVSHWQELSLQQVLQHFKKAILS